MKLSEMATKAYEIHKTANERSQRLKALIVKGQAHEGFLRLCGIEPDEIIIEYERAMIKCEGLVLWCYPLEKKLSFTLEGICPKCAGPAESKEFSELWELGRIQGRVFDPAAWHECQKPTE